MLSEVGTRAGDDDAQLVGVVAGELGGFGRAGQLDRAFGAADAAFAVGDQRQQRRLAAHPAGRAQFGQRLRPVAAVIGRDADGLADGGDAAGPRRARPGVLQRGLGVVVEEFAGGDEVLARRSRPSAWSRVMSSPRIVGRQLLGLDVGGNRRASVGPGASPSWCRAGRADAGRRRSGPDVRGAERRRATAPRRSPPRCLSWTTYAFLFYHRTCKGYGDIRRIRDELSNLMREYRITPHAIVGGDSNVCSAVSYFSTRVG